MEYNTKSSVAVVADSLFIAPLMAITRPNSAMTSPQNSNRFVTIVYASPGFVATPNAVKPVITSASAIHKYTFLISDGNARATVPSFSSIIL